ncbi:hypothetical protein [Rhizobium leguminosarum]|uniref:hypothetical protein n=1 Tax=Rhizobium TaxID=379 RepID=UPI00103138DC|nr:hypothetical protein [Rhizobium leguminosarum]TAV40668.1 hypothetical protein ELI31_35415 [Rhizobium leguminosarum]TAV41236.1 hypothetical protein ELI32_35410 [Rhizobium leguminosarum]TAV61101.1 hypothetical protein ELI30_35200 [Rhizobium leguminosarum]TAY61121.1 hypothetical protein ELH82_33040 [Rhizobium leguminosarum]
MTNRRSSRNIHIAGASALVLAILAPFQATGWESDEYSFLKVLSSSTHTQITRAAFDEVVKSDGELFAHKRSLIAGANTELHDRPAAANDYGLDLDKKRKEHKPKNGGTGDIAGWWKDALTAYRNGNTERAYFLLGVVLHYVQDMGAPAGAKDINHGGNLSNFDSFELIAARNWQPSFKNPPEDPEYADPSAYYAFARDLTKKEMPDYTETSSFSNTWLAASAEEKKAVSRREGVAVLVTTWALRAALKEFGGKEDKKFPSDWDRKTAVLVLEAVSDGGYAGPDDLETMRKALENSMTVEQIDQGFARLQPCRTVRKFRDNPLYLVAAEHYAYMRQQASKSGDIGFREVPDLYYTTKIRVLRQGIDERLQTTSQKIAPPSLGVADWGKLGVEHGLADYRARTGLEPKKGTEAAGHIREMKLAEGVALLGIIDRNTIGLAAPTEDSDCSLDEPEFQIHPTSTGNLPMTIP